MEDKVKKYVAVLDSSESDDGKTAWYVRHAEYRDVPDFALWFCVWNTVKGKTELELYQLPNGEFDRDQLEKYKVWSKPLDPSISGIRNKMQAKIDAFGELFAKFVEMQPADHYGILTMGHGSANHVLGDVIETGYSRPLLTKIREALGGKNLTFMDSSTQCNAGSWVNLEVMATGVDYYLATALKVGGIDIKVGDRKVVDRSGVDRAADQKLLEARDLRSGKNYNKGFEDKPDRTIKGSLIKLAMMEQSYWAKCAEDKDIINMISENNMEEVAIYDCTKVAALRDALGWKTFDPNIPISQILAGAPKPTDKNCYADGTYKFVDMQSYVLEHKPTAKDALDKVMVYYTSNEQFGVNWPINNKGTPATTTSHGLCINLASYLGIT